VRKIPTRKHPVIQAGGILPAQGSSEPEPDEPAVASFLSQIRDTVLTDRALNDKVLGAISSYALREVQGHVIGSERLRVFRAGVFEARGLVHLSNKRSRSHRRSQKLWASPSASHAGAQGREQNGMGKCVFRCEPSGFRVTIGATLTLCHSGTPMLMPTGHKKLNVESRSANQKSRKRRPTPVPRSASEMRRGASKRQIKKKGRSGS
jgi:hypothetical protein